MYFLALVLWHVYKRFVILSGYICLLVVVLPHCPSSMEIKCLASRFLIYVSWRDVSARFYLTAQMWWLIFYFDLQERKISLVSTAGQSLRLADYCCLLFAASSNHRFSSLSAAAPALTMVVCFRCIMNQAQVSGFTLLKLSVACTV